MDDMSWVFALAIEMDKALAKALEQATVVSEDWEEDDDIFDDEDDIFDDEDEELDDWEDDCDYEMGFDPYMGCFSDDC